MVDVNMEHSVVLTDIDKISIDIPIEYGGETPYTFKHDNKVYGFRTFANGVAYVTIGDYKTIEIKATHRVEKLSESEARIHFPIK